MIKKSTKSRRGQSILEYICVCLVFATVGIATFMAAIKGAALARQGMQDSYLSTNTLMGETLDDGVAEGEYQWSSAWDEAQETMGGRSTRELVGAQDEITQWSPPQEQQEE